MTQSPSLLCTDFTTVVRGNRIIERQLFGMNLKLEFQMTNQDTKYNRGMSFRGCVNGQYLMTSFFTTILDSLNTYPAYCGKQLGDERLIVMIEGNSYDNRIYNEVLEARVVVRAHKGELKRGEPDLIGLESCLPFLAHIQPERFGLEPRVK